MKGYDPKTFFFVWNTIQIKHCSKELWPGHGFSVCVHRDLELRDMALWQVNDKPLGHGQQLSEIVTRSIQHGSGESWPRHRFCVCMHCDLDLGDMSLHQRHDTPLGHGQQLCKILPRSNMVVRSCGPDTDLKYVCTVTLTIGIWHWVKIMTHARSWTTIV